MLGAGTNNALQLQLTQLAGLHNGGGDAVPQGIGGRWQADGTAKSRSILENASATASTQHL